MKFSVQLTVELDTLEISGARYWNGYVRDVLRTLAQSAEWEISELRVQRIQEKEEQEAA